MTARAAGIVLVAMLAAPAAAQTPGASALLPVAGAAQPGPGGELAPRLQNLGRPHVQGHDALGARAAVHQPGAEPGLRLQPCRGWPRVRRSGAARSVVRDGLLGPGARARSQHQRGDGAGRRAQGAGARAEGGGGQGPAPRRASGPTSRRCAPATPARPSDRLAGRSRLRGGHAQDGPRLSRRPRRRDAVRRIADGPAAVELLDEGRRGATTARSEAVALARSACSSVNRSHPGALHYWIHLWEPTKTPERAEKEADRLLPLMPGAGTSSTCRRTSTCGSGATPTR